MLSIKYYYAKNVIINVLVKGRLHDKVELKLRMYMNLCYTYLDNVIGNGIANILNSNTMLFVK
jgi:hypothetical protein